MLEGNLRKLGGEIASRGEAAGFVIIEEGVDLLRHFPHLARLEKRCATEGSNPRLADPRQASYSHV